MEKDRSDERRTEEGPSASLTPASGKDELDRLLPVVMRELRSIAHRQLKSERTNHTLCTTGLVNELYLRLVEQRTVDWSNRQAFFALASHAMRRILVDSARRYRAKRRGRGAVKYRLDDLDTTTSGSGPRIQIATAARAQEFLALDEALDRLAQINKRAATVVELRFFGGLTEAEAALVLEVDSRTVTRDWKSARSWLLGELEAARD